MKYEVEIYQDYKPLGGRRISYGYDTLDEVKERIQTRKDNETVLSIMEYHLVYQHPISLPMCHEIMIYSRREIYHDWVKIPKENIQTAKQKSYKQNFMETDDFSHYCLKYETLTKDEYHEYIYKVGATYDLKNSDRQATMKTLYEHSKSNRIFNLRLYQYRYLSLEDVCK